MSYNISTWKTKKLRNLIIPLSALYDLPPDLIQRGWEVDAPIFDYATGTVHIGFGGVSYIKGYLLDTSRDELQDAVLVSEIDFYGEGSGTFFTDIFVPALKRSKGKLVATLIWEGGDYINSISVEDGTITERKIEL